MLHSERSIASFSVSLFPACLYAPDKSHNDADAAYGEYYE